MTERILLALGLAVMTVRAGDRSDVIRVVHEPRLVPMVSSKSEWAWAKCGWCGANIHYTRTYRWDVYGKKWDETTKDVPELCRKCEKERAGQKKLEKEEARLDRKIEKLDTQRRIKEKQQIYREKRLQR